MTVIIPLSDEFLPRHALRILLNVYINMRHVERKTMRLNISGFICFISLFLSTSHIPLFIPFEESQSRRQNLHYHIIILLLLLSISFLCFWEKWPISKGLNLFSCFQFYPIRNRLRWISSISKVQRTSKIQRCVSFGYAVRAMANWRVHDIRYHRIPLAYTIYR